MLAVVYMRCVRDALLSMLQRCRRRQAFWNCFLFLRVQLAGAATATSLHIATLFTGAGATLAGCLQLASPVVWQPTTGVGSPLPPRLSVIGSFASSTGAGSDLCWKCMSFHSNEPTQPENCHVALVGAVVLTVR
jgi:hypothetical protein